MNRAWLFLSETKIVYPLRRTKNMRMSCRMRSTLYFMNTFWLRTKNSRQLKPSGNITTHFSPPRRGASNNLSGTQFPVWLKRLAATINNSFYKFSSHRPSNPRSKAAAAAAGVVKTAQTSTATMLNQEKGDSQQSLQRSASETAAHRPVSGPH